MNTSSSDSEEEAVIIAMALVEHENQKKKKRLWVHDINAVRNEEGEFHTLFNRLIKDSKRFFCYFRMSYEKFTELLTLIEPLIKKQDTNLRKSISPKERLGVTLRFLGHAGTYRSVAFSYRLGESTVADIVYSTCKAIWQKLLPIVMPQPTCEKWIDVASGFEEKWQFPNALGTLDGKHVMIEKPKNSGSLYFNYKKGFSIVLMALADAHCKFTAVYVGAYGKNSDGGVFKNCRLGKMLFDDRLDIPPPKALGNSSIVLPYVMIGDEAFPLHKNIMRPFPGPQLINNTSNKIYNYRHSRARRTVESAFGMLAKKFRIYSQKLQIKPEHVDVVVLATTCLHNFLKGDDENLWQQGELLNDEEFHGLQSLQRTGGSYGMDAFEIREGFKQYFNSNHGQVPWQEEIINRGRIS